MSDPVSLIFELPENASKDIELMSIWMQSYDRYSSELTPERITAALNWFHSFVESECRECRTTINENAAK